MDASQPASGHTYGTPGSGRLGIERIPVEKPFERAGDRNEHAGPPEHDLRHAAEAFQNRLVRVERSRTRPRADGRMAGIPRRRRTSR